MGFKFSRVYVEITNICNLNCSFCNKPKKYKEPQGYAKDGFVEKFCK